jgi:hypothetical protein
MKNVMKQLINYNLDTDLCDFVKEKISQAQISKIENELDFFKKDGLDFTITDVSRIPHWKHCVGGVRYELNNNNGVELLILYELSYSKRLSCRYFMWSEKFGTYVKYNIKTFKEFRKDFE